ncbi:hypothetical protein [Methanohalobium sp.]|nr:hypothetical protein [Methanohalobium sp.]
MLQNSDDPQMQEFAKLVTSGKGQPDEDKLNKAREFAKKVISQKKTWG